MSKSLAGRLISVLLLGFLFHGLRVVSATDALVLSEVRLVGSDQLSPEDLTRGLDLKLGVPTSRQSLVRACDRFRQLKLFGSPRCTYTTYGHSVSLTIFVKPIGMPVVFDNFVWTTRPELLARLKQEIPLFMPDLPESCGLTDDIIRVLEQVVNERGIKAPVRYDAHFWTNRGMNVFYIEGISTPVTALQIEGINAPSPEETLKFSQFYTKENFSAARLTWVIHFVIRDLYKTRGYLRPVVGKPVTQFLGEKDGAYPVRVVLPISSGDLYLFDSVNFEGLAKPHAALLLSKWKLGRGDPYNESYVNEFISKEILDAPWAAHSKSGSDVALPCTRIDAVTKKVSLTVTVEVPKKTYSSARHSDEECDDGVGEAYPLTSQLEAAGWSLVLLSSLLTEQPCAI
jgi:outer membrane protein assembly factor BamA